MLPKRCVSKRRARVKVCEGSADPRHGRAISTTFELAAMNSLCKWDSNKVYK